jgi:hypothetical protein
MSCPHGMPRELAELLGLKQPRDESKQVIITELEGKELLLFAESQKARHEMMRMVKKLERLKKQEELYDAEIWEHVEHRLGTPPDISLTLNNRTKQVSMDRDDADFLKVKYTDRSIHPEMAETDQRAYSEHFKK